MEKKTQIHAEDGKQELVITREFDLPLEFNGTIHEFIPNQKITRTFEMESAAIGPQLEFLEFEKLSDTRSKLTMQVIYRSVEARAMQLQMPFAMGLNMAHDRIEELLKN